MLLAGLYAKGETRVIEPAISRDHTERMLVSLGVPVRRRGLAVVVDGGAQLSGTRLSVPGDLSSAAFMVLAGCLATEGELLIEGVGLNPTRTGILQVLELMGANLRVEPTGSEGGEPVGRLIVRPSALRGWRYLPRWCPSPLTSFP